MSSSKLRLSRWLSVAFLIVLWASGSAGELRAQQADSARAGIKPKADTATKRVTTPPPTDSARRRQRPAQPISAARRDSLQPPVSPGKAFLLSAAIPGLGQSRLNRPTAGAVYLTAEAVWIAMLAKAANDLRIAKEQQNNVVILTYKVDPTTGAPVMSGGNFVVQDSLRSRYAPPVTATTADQQQRSRVKARRLHLEDWVAMIFFNHLFSGADAFVSSHLWDLPAAVELKSLPSGVVGVGAKINFR